MIAEIETLNQLTLQSGDNYEFQVIKKGKSIKKNTHLNILPKKKNDTVLEKELLFLRNNFEANEEKQTHSEEKIESLEYELQQAINKL